MGGPAGTQPLKAGPGQVRSVPTAQQVAAQVHAWTSVPSASRWKVCSPFMGHSGCCIRYGLCHGGCLACPSCLSSWSCCCSEKLAVHNQQCRPWGAWSHQERWAQR